MMPRRTGATHAGTTSQEPTMKLFHPLSFFAASLFLFASCSSSVYRDVYPTLIDGRYDSEFPYRGCSQQLEEVAETVKRITVMAHYKAYAFPLADSVTIGRISKPFLENLEPAAAYQHFSSAGTGTVIYNGNGRVAVLTCAHIVDFADTLTTHYLGRDNRTTPYLRSIAVKSSQLAFLNDVPGGSSLEILVTDRTTDIALLGQRLTESQSSFVRVFRYPLGRAKQLEWGSFVYLFGYPSGYRMVTKGIVSLSSKAPGGSFVIDAVTSPGSSGSIALAIRDGVPNFELVGMVKMIPAQVSHVLTPSRDGDVEYDPLSPYHGEVFVQRKLEMQQGIAVAIPIETVVAFLNRHDRQLREMGYDVVDWLIPEKTQKQ